MMAITLSAAEGAPRVGREENLLWKAGLVNRQSFPKRPALETGSPERVSLVKVGWYVWSDRMLQTERTAGEGQERAVSWCS